MDHLPKSYGHALHGDPREYCGILQQRQVPRCGDWRQSTCARLGKSLLRSQRWDKLSHRMAVTTAREINSDRALRRGDEKNKGGQGEGQGDQSQRL